MKQKTNLFTTEIKNFCSPKNIKENKKINHKLEKVISNTYNQKKRLTPRIYFKCSKKKNDR